MPPKEDCAELLRQDLDRAGCDREELTADDAQREPLTFHKLRHTCGIHMAVRRDPPFDVQWRMGHTNATMTEHYIAEARQAAGANFGTPLPGLPAELFEALDQVTEPGHSASKSSELLRPQRELKKLHNVNRLDDLGAVQTEESAETSRVVPATVATEHDSRRNDAQSALRGAIKRALDAGDLDAVARLLAELRGGDGR